MSGIASIEQIALLTLIFGVVAPMAWYLGSREMETLTNCSTDIELSLFNGDSSHSDQSQLSGKDRAPLEAEVSEV